jgi:hypothetical protein
MHLFSKLCLIAALLAVSLKLYCQERYHSSDPDLLARLSLDNSGALQTGGTLHICITVLKDGSYQMVRRLAPPGPMQRLEGTLSHEQLQQLQKLVGSSDLRSVSGNHGGLIRQSAESFAAEIPFLGNQAGDDTLHLQWLNADGNSPFPPPVSKVAGWLSSFEPGNAKPSADLEFQDVCPSVGLHFLQPSVASNLP